MSVTNRYFLAANGFLGFRCHFWSLLKSEDIKKLYIIKGGSGVGKSTLMRRISAYFSDAGFSVEEILCSSDPSSLDGVVINSSGGRIVLIDGTAPHEYDMKYPAMRDITVDLSRHLNERELEKHGAKIKRLIKEKKKCYDTAYKNLHLAGISYKAILETTMPYARSIEIKNLAKKLFSDENTRAEKLDLKLYSAFCKEGLILLDRNDEQYKKAYYFDSGYKTHILFSQLYGEIKKRGYDITVFPSPFSDDVIDGFSVNDEVLFKIRDSAPTYKSDCYFDNFDGRDGEIINSYEKIFNLSLEAAKQSLKWAFENHRSLEEIYGSHMDFEKNTRLSEDLIAKIKFEL